MQVFGPGLLVNGDEKTKISEFRSTSKYTVPTLELVRGKQTSSCFCMCICIVDMVFICLTSSTGFVWHFMYHRCLADLQGNDQFL